MNSQPVNNRLKIIIATFLSAFVVLIVVNLWQNNQHKGKVFLELYKAPKDTAIYINDQKVSRSPYLTPGKYKLRGEKNGFETDNREIEVKGDKPMKAFFLLTPISEEAEKWVEEHQDDYTKLESIAGEYYGKEGQDLTDKYPIMKNLPYRSTLYDIDYSLSGDNLTIQINASDALGRQVAIEQLKSFGAEPSDYDIQFLGHYSPFVSEEE